MSLLTRKSASEYSTCGLDVPLPLQAKDGAHVRPIPLGGTRGRADTETGSRAPAPYRSGKPPRMLRHHDPGRMEDAPSENIGKATARSETWPDVGTVVAAVSDGHVEHSIVLKVLMMMMWFEEHQAWQNLHVHGRYYTYDCSSSSRLLWPAFIGLQAENSGYRYLFNLDKGVSTRKNTPSVAPWPWHPTHCPTINRQLRRQVRPTVAFS